MLREGERCTIDCGWYLEYYKLAFSVEAHCPISIGRQDVSIPRLQNVKDMITILKSKIQSNSLVSDRWLQVMLVHGYALTSLMFPLNVQNSHPVFEDDAIQFAARKAASVSGDIRKALHICKSCSRSCHAGGGSGHPRRPEK